MADPNNETKSPASALVAGGLLSEAVAIAERYVEPTTIVVKPQEAGETPVAIIPKGFELKSLEPFLDENRQHPKRRRGTAVLLELASFVAHVRRFKDADTVIFANPGTYFSQEGGQSIESPELVAILDYHEAGPIGDAKPRFGEHRAVYPCPLSREWKAWARKAETYLTPYEFAVFLEERIQDIVAIPAELPAKVEELRQLLGGTIGTAAQILEVARGFELRVTETIKQVGNQDDGTFAVAWKQEHGGPDGSPLRVPSLFAIGVPVFQGGAPYQILVRLRYRTVEGQVKWAFSLYRQDAVFEDAIKDLTLQAQAETGVPVLLGKPESPR